MQKLMSPANFKVERNPFVDFGATHTHRVVQYVGAFETQVACHGDLKACKRYVYNRTGVWV